MDEAATMAQTSCCANIFSKRGYAVLITLVFALDLLISFLVYQIARTDDVEVHDRDRYAATSSDTIECCLIRILVFPLMSAIALKVYRRTAASSPLLRLQAEQAHGSPDSRSNSMVTINGAEDNSSIVSSDSMRVPLAAAGSNGAAGAGLGVVSSNGSAEVSTVASNSGASSATGSGRPKSPDTVAFEMKRDHTLLMKKAEERKAFVMAALYAVSIGMAMYNGLKCVNFHYDPKIITLQASLLFLIIVFINAEYFLIRDYLAKLTEEKGELIPHIHMHELFFETGIKCHTCDVCHERTKGPHYIAYRCHTCDFDLCPRCYKQKDKPNAKGYGARSVRRDGEQITTWSYFKRIVKLAMERSKTAMLALLCLVMTQSLQIYAPSIQGTIFDSVISYLKDPTGDGRDAFERAVSVYLIVNILQGAFGGLKALTQELVTRNLACSVRVKLFTSIVRMDIPFFDTMHTGQLTSRLTNDASQMVQPLNTLLNDLVANLMLLVGGMFMAFKTSWKLSILALTVVPPITFCYRTYAKWANKINRSIYAAYGEANSVATEAISNIRTVRGFSTERDESDKYDDAIATALKHAVKNAYVQGSVTAFTTYLNLGTAVLILWYGGSLVLDSGGTLMSIGKLITFQLYWNMMNSAFIQLGNVFNDLIRSSSAAERVFSLIDARPEVDPDMGDEVTRGGVKGHLALRGLEFRYRTRPDNLVLKGVNLEMPPGTTTALVGKSGGGKSTLVHLLMRFYEPTNGKIILDGRDMHDLSSKSLRKLCGFVAQDTQLFATSIEENLVYGLGRPCNHEEVVAACEAANAHSFIMECEEQYETRVGEKGVMLSGGQKQRLAIARCFLRRPRLLFLDEATSALDAENEALVQSALEDLIGQGECTVVLIAHRLSTVINSNQIAVVHKGQIVERGTHEELCKMEKGIYAQLVQRQMSRDASTVVEERSKKASGGGAKTVQGEIDTLMEELEASGDFKIGG